MAVSSSGNVGIYLDAADLIYSVRQFPALAVGLVALCVWIFICPCLGHHVYSLKVPQL